jgi:uncharacterized membrane protein
MEKRPGTKRSKLTAVQKNHWLTLTAIPRISIALGIGIACSVLVGIFISWEYFPLTLWNVTALVVLVPLWFSIFRFDAEQTAEFASREDPGRGAANIILILASIVSLVAVGVLLVQSGTSHGALQILQIALGLISIIISWGVIHTVFMLRYADLYFKGNGGINFNSKGTADAPTYSDFAYVAFTIGMTYQVSDTNMETAEIRRAVLYHALLSFVFGTAIIASTINFVAGLAK